MKMNNNKNVQDHACQRNKKGVGFGPEEEEGDMGLLMQAVEAGMIEEISEDIKKA